MEVLDFPSLGHGWKLLIFDDPSPKLLATRTAVPALASSMMRVAEGLVLKLSASILFLLTPMSISWLRGTPPKIAMYR